VKRSVLLRTQTVAELQRVMRPNSAPETDFAAVRRQSEPQHAKYVFLVSFCWSLVFAGVAMKKPYLASTIGLFPSVIIFLWEKYGYVSDCPCV